MTLSGNLFFKSNVILKGVPLFNSANEYLHYLQKVLKQTDIFETANKDGVDKWNSILETREKEYPIQKNEHSTVQVSQETIDLINENYGFDIKEINQEEHISSKYTLSVILEEINKKLPIEIKQKVKNMAIGTLFKFFPDAKTLKSNNNYYAVLVSGSMLQLLYNNICFLEATAAPENVEYYSGSDIFKEFTSKEYSLSHHEYLTMSREVQIPATTIFSFNAKSSEYVYLHFELIVTFIIFHEYAHMINGDLDKSDSFSGSFFKNKDDIELKADETAIDLMVKYYLPNFSSKITPIELLLMIEYYFFRLLHAFNPLSNNYPVLKERVNNLLKYSSQYDLSQNLSFLSSNKINEIYT